MRVPKEPCARTGTAPSRVGAVLGLRSARGSGPAGARRRHRARLGARDRQGRQGAAGASRCRCSRAHPDVPAGRAAGNRLRRPVRCEQGPLTTSAAHAGLRKIFGNHRTRAGGTGRAAPRPSPKLRHGSCLGERGPGCGAGPHGARPLDSASPSPACRPGRRQQRTPPESASRWLSTLPIISTSSRDRRRPDHHRRHDRPARLLETCPARHGPRGDSGWTESNSQRSCVAVDNLTFDVLHEASGRPGWFAARALLPRTSGATKSPPMDRSVDRFGPTGDRSRPSGMRRVRQAPGRGGRLAYGEIASDLSGTKRSSSLY